jgi:hypothetical protein
MVKKNKRMKKEQLIAEIRYPNFSARNENDGERKCNRRYPISQRTSDSSGYKIEFGLSELNITSLPNIIINHYYIEI